MKEFFVFTLIFMTNSCSTQKNRLAEDSYRHLEEIEDSKNLEWVKEQNQLTENWLSKNPLFKTLEKESLELLESSDRIAYVQPRGLWLYNFWQDAKNVRGLLRRTTLSEYQKKTPEWETVLDIDQLSKNENKNWVYKSLECLEPTYDRCLINLSDGGKDATYIREFDLKTLKFIDGKMGFQLSEAKQHALYFDKDTLIVMAAQGSSTVTESGYSRLVKIWKRGVEFENAKTIWEVSPKSVSVWGLKHEIEDKNYILFLESVEIWANRYALLKPNAKAPQLLDIPQHFEFVNFTNEYALFKNQEAWKDSPAGSLWAFSLVDEKWNLVWTPKDKQSFVDTSVTSEGFLLESLVDVKSQLEAISPPSHKIGSWKTKVLRIPKNSSLSSVRTDPYAKGFFVSYESFLDPTSLLYFRDFQTKPEVLEKLPEHFKKDNLLSEQRFAKSADGTMIPYFVIRNKDRKLDSTTPTILYGYGGFQHSMNPFYIETPAKLWISRGGAYVLANIRGGGEYGPAWHQAALKTSRHKSYEDFEAVAEDLPKWGLTSPQKLAISGGSNGGLLVGAVATRRPELMNAVICSVPLLDMLHFHELLAGASWMGEYGDPRSPEIADYWKKLSPYQNVFTDKKYPSIFFMTSTKDDRVHPGHARKMYAKMKAQGHDVYYFENIEGGHGAASNRKQKAYQNALSYTYLFEKLFPEFLKAE